MSCVTCKLLLNVANARALVSVVLPPDVVSVTPPATKPVPAV